jgi:hypothetical protein
VPEGAQAAHQGGVDAGANDELPSTDRFLGIGNDDRDTVARPEESSSEDKGIERPRAPLVSRYDRPLGPPRELAVIPEFLREEMGSDGPYASPMIEHRVELTVDQPCWIQFFIDDDDARVAILQPGDPVAFSAVSSLRINVGNPDGVTSVIHNGRPFDPTPWCIGPPWWITFPLTPEGSPCPDRDR